MSYYLCTYYAILACITYMKCSLMYNIMSAFSLVNTLVTMPYSRSICAPEDAPMSTGLLFG